MYNPTRRSPEGYFPEGYFPDGDYFAMQGMEEEARRDAVLDTTHEDDLETDEEEYSVFVRNVGEDDRVLSQFGDSRAATVFMWNNQRKVSGSLMVRVKKGGSVHLVTDTAWFKRLSIFDLSDALKKVCQYCWEYGRHSEQCLTR